MAGRGTRRAKRFKNHRRSKSRPPNQPRSSDPPTPLRREGKIYSFTERHQLTVMELHRLFPDRPLVVDFGRITPGLESIETISCQLFKKLRSELDHATFMVFCRLNSERALDYVEHCLDLNAWPLEAEGILSEVFARLHRALLRRSAGEPIPESCRCFSQEPTATRTLYHMFAQSADEVIAEHLEHLMAFTVPLPGLPAPPVRVASSTFEEGAARLLQRNVKLSESDLRQWIVHALLQMDVLPRRLIHLREQRGWELDRIGEALGLSAFEAGRQLQEAYLQLWEGLHGLATFFQGEPEESSEESNDGAH